MKKAYQEGQSLFEVVVAIAISALIITAIVALASTSIQNSSFSRDKTLASGYVEEAMEWLRLERDQNSAVFTSKALPGAAYCLSSIPTGILWNAPAGRCSLNQTISGSKFTREVDFLACNGCSANTIEVSVTVSWQDSKGLHDVSGSTDLILK